MDTLKQWMLSWSYAQYQPWQGRVIDVGLQKQIFIYQMSCSVGVLSWTQLASAALHLRAVIRGEGTESPHTKVKDIDEEPRESTTHR